MDYSLLVGIEKCDFNEQNLEKQHKVVISQSSRQSYDKK